MKIIESGKFAKDSESVIFTCPNCGCKFRAKTDEYYQDTSWWSGDSITLTATCTSCYKVRNHANCPECHKMCHESVMKSWASPTVTWTTATGTPVSTKEVTVTCESKTDGECNGNCSV